MLAFRQLIHLETVFPLSCHGRCQHVDCAVLQSFDHLLRKVGRLEEKWLTETKKKNSPGSSAGLYLGSQSKFPRLLIFLALIGLQHNWILPRNDNVLPTCDSNERVISALPKCENENAVRKCPETDVNSVHGKCGSGYECF